MNILVVTQHIFPIKTPRAHRSTELIKELAIQGHKVTVYAVLGSYDYSEFEKKYGIKLKNIPVKFQFHPYTSDGDGKRLFIDKVFGKILGKAFEFPYIEFKYSIPRILKHETKHDVLISISEPHHIHWGCARAKKKGYDNFPPIWIADSGDPFMDNGNSKIHLKKFAKEEHEFCKTCDFITVPVEEARNGYYPEYKNKIHIIPQGFQFEYPIEEIEVENEVIQFAYAGMFYDDIRNPKKILDILFESSKDFRFHIFTSYTKLIDEYKDKLGTKIIIHSPVERDTLIQKLKTMDFLLNIENINSPNQVPSKLIDYAITSRPILSVNPENPDKKKITDFLNRNYSERKIIENISQYQITQVTKKFIELARK